MFSFSSVRKAAVVGIGAILSCTALSSPAQAQKKAAARTCIDYSNDVAGCQPSTFPTPTGQIPSRRVGRDGQINAKSSEAEARAGAALLEKKLHLFRNIEPLHWVLTTPSTQDASGNWTGGDLDAMGDARGLAIGGSCIFVGHENGLGQKHAINIFRIAADPVKNPPVQVGEIPALGTGRRRIRRPRAALAPLHDVEAGRSGRFWYATAARSRSVARSCTTSIPPPAS